MKSVANKTPASIPGEIKRLHSEVQARAKTGTLDQRFIEFLYLDHYGSRRYHPDLVSRYKKRLKAKMGTDFQRLSKGASRKAHLKFIKTRIALYPELHIRQAMPHVSAVQVLHNNEFANCADFAKAFIQLGLDQGIPNKSFKVCILAEQKSLKKVFLKNKRPRLDRTNLNGIHFSFTYSVAFQKNRKWFLINPEIKDLEVFSLGKEFIKRGDTFHFPFFASIGYSDYVMGGTMDLDLFLNGYDISSPINLCLSGSVHDRSPCRG